MHQEILLILQVVIPMPIKIGHASIDERGKISGGKAGDQTGKEIRIREWYSKPWNIYLECIDKGIADKAASFMDQICADNNYGYDQIERWTGYYAIRKNADQVAGAKGEFDCSSLVITCYLLAGVAMSADGYTGNLKSKLLATGKFKCYADKKYLLTDTYAKRGAIYLKEGNHVVMALEDEASRLNPYPVPIATVSKGSKGDDVRYIQLKLIEAGITEAVINGKTKLLTVDGEFGPITDKAVRMFQEMHNLEVDGRVGPITRKTLQLY